MLFLQLRWRGGTRTPSRDVARGDVEASLFSFVFNVATAVLAHIVQDFGKEVLEVFLCAVDASAAVGVEVYVADIEGCPEAMADESTAIRLTRRSRRTTCWVRSKLVTLSR